MGGMFTILKVREHLKSYADPGWYRHPRAYLSHKATTGDMKRDGIEADTPDGMTPAPMTGDHMKH